jgi:hypothetical protein
MPRFERNNVIPDDTVVIKQEPLPPVIKQEPLPPVIRIVGTTHAANKFQISRTLRR